MTANARHLEDGNGGVGVDLSSLLAPISATSPSGLSLRYEPIYDSVREMRKQDDPTLPQGVWQRELKRADWGEVARLTSEALESRSKDLQLAAWLTEAWTHLHGFAGCEHGLRLVIGLVDDFWADVHPQIDDGDLDYRLAPLLWLDDVFPATLRAVPLTRPNSEDVTPYTWNDWEMALYRENLVATDREAAERAEAEGKVTEARFLVSISLTPSPFFRSLVEQLTRTAEAVTELDQKLDERLEDRSPGLSKLRRVGAEILDFVEQVLEERQEPEEPEADLLEEPRTGDALMEMRPTPINQSLEISMTSSGGRITNRAEAYRRLHEAADFLMRTEPHSPVPYLIRRAVSWGNLSLAELLGELLKDNSDLATVYRLLGIRAMDLSGE